MFHQTTSADAEINSSGSEPPYFDRPGTLTALEHLGRALRQAGYDWICPTPDTQALVNARSENAEATNLAGVFGWNRPFHPELLVGALPDQDWRTLRHAGILVPSYQPDRWVSRVRFSTFENGLMAHSGWPTTATDAVFFGPDTYRFGNFITDELHHRRLSVIEPDNRPLTLVDLGCGTGAGGILAARLLAEAATENTLVLLTDINPTTLQFAAVNAQLAGLTGYSCRCSDVLRTVPEPVDLVLANPPYLLDPLARSYRHGGGELGIGLALRIAEETLVRLTPGGTLLLYSAAPVVAGVDRLWQALQQPLARAVADRGAQYRYRMLDPDVFGSELAQPAYARVERLAAVGLTVTIPVPN